MAACFKFEVRIMKKALYVKKIVALFLSVLLLLSFVGCGGGSSANSPKDFEYEEVSGGLKITKYVGKSNVVVIPSVIEDKKVVSMSSSAFSGNVKLKEITLPDTFTTVSFGYFENCEALEKIVYTGSVSDVYDVYSTIYDTLSSFKSLEIHSIEEAALYNLRRMIKYTGALENIKIREIAKTEDRDFSLGEEEIYNIERELSIEIPQDMADKYLGKTAHARYYIDNVDNSLIPFGYELCSDLVYGKDFNMPVIARNRTLSELSDKYNIEVSDLRFTEVDEEDTDIEDSEPDVYLRATAKYNGKNVIFVSDIGYAGDNWDETDGWVIFDVNDAYEVLEDEAKMCILFGVSKVKVNGVSYQIKQ